MTRNQDQNIHPLMLPLTISEESTNERKIAEQRDLAQRVVARVLFESSQHQRMIVRNLRNRIERRPANDRILRLDESLGAA